MRFGLVVRDASDPREPARRAEGVGYDAVRFPDHLGYPDPFVASAVAGSVTTTVRVGPYVTNIALRPLGLLAQLAASVDEATGGRLDLGLGAGHAAEEHAAIGVPFPSAADRISQLEVALDVLPRLFAGETVTVAQAGIELDDHTLAPLPPQGADLPLLVGGNGDRVLRLGATRAHDVGLTGFGPASGGPSLTHFTWPGLEDRVAVVDGAAGDRRVGRSVLIQHVHVTDQPRAAAEELAAVRSGALTVADALASPFLLLGTREAITERLSELEERLGVTEVCVFDVTRGDFDEVVQRR